MAYRPRHRTKTRKAPHKTALANLRFGTREIAKRQLAELHVTISPGNVKTGLIPSVSLPPIVSCPPGVPCAGSCYILANKYSSPHGKAIAKSYAKNMRIWQENPARFRVDLRHYLRKHRPPFFRWHVSGDIPSQAYWRMMCDMARQFPETRFLAFTKAYGLTFRNRPENLSLVFSAWPGLELPRKARRYPIAYIDLDDRRPADCLSCPGNCETCGLCWELPTIGRNVYFPLH